MKKKLIAIFSIICTLLLSMAVFAACGESNSGGGTGSPDSVTLNKEELSLDVNENFRLLVDGKKYSGSWSSSDKEIATVDNGGLVTGLKEGEAVITVTVGDESAECRVTVYRSGYTPVLETNQDDVTLGHSGEYPIFPFVTVGGAKVSDEISYSWKYAENADENIVSFTALPDGGIVLKGKNVGTTQLYVTTTARKVMLAKEVTVTVVDDDIILMITNLEVEEGSYRAELALTNGHGYSNAVTPQFLVYEGNTHVTAPTLTWETENKGIVLEENGTLTAQDFGTETVTVSFGKSVATIVIDVIRPVVASLEIAERTELNLDAVVSSSGALISSPTTIAPVDLSALELEGLASVASAKDAYGEALDVSRFTANGSTLGIPVNVFDVGKYGDSQISVVVEDAYFAYEVKIPLYLVTKFIKTPADMNVVFFNGTDIRGYFVLGSDVDYRNDTSLAKQYTHGDGAGGFRGIFDGRGFTIKNYAQPMTNKVYSLFGQLRGGTVKNVNFENVVLNIYNTSALIARNAWENSHIENITINNCSFVSNTEDKNAYGASNGGLLIGWWISASYFSDINITLGTTNGVEGYLHRLFGAGAGDGYASIGGKVTNVNVYNAKQGQVNEIQGTGNNNAAVNAAMPGLKIYTDNGTREYQF